MSKSLPEEITRALELLKSSENIHSHQERVRLFNDGIDILNSCLNDFPHHEHLIKSYKSSHARSLITQLSSTRPDVSLDEWLEYVNLLCIKVRKEISEIIETDPEMRRYFLNFVGEGMLDVADE